MPTFLKDLNNVQLKVLWQKAGVELSEAKGLVFIGYSFPASDFEFRYLLSSFVRKNATIEVVLHESDEQQFPVNHKSKISHLPEFRYRSFFGNREISFNYEGVQKYIEGLLNKKIV